MKYRISILSRFILAIIFFSAIGCDSINLPDSNSCDDIEDYDYLTVKVSEKSTVIWDSVIENNSVIRELIAIEREPMFGPEHPGFAVCLEADKNIQFVRLDSILTEFRKASLLRFYLKTNGRAENCGIRLRLLPYAYVIDSLYHNILEKPIEERNRIGALVVEYHSADSIMVNELVFSNYDFIANVEELINKKKKYGYLIHPRANDTYGRIIELMDLYNKTIIDLRTDLSIKNYGCSFIDLEIENKNEITKSIPNMMSLIHLLND